MVQSELDSFYVKFKNLLRAEKDATLTLKIEAGRAFVTLSLDLGHVLSEQDLSPRGGPRNGPARIRRREKRAAAREKLATEDENVESTANVEETETNDKPAADEANRKVKATDNVAKARQDEEPIDAEQAEVQRKATAEKVKELIEEETAGKVDDVADEFCTDDVYNSQSNETKSVASQTLERGPLPNSSSSKPGFDYYTLRYDDFSD
jgi:hypothetical protein